MSKKQPFKIKSRSAKLPETGKIRSGVDNYKTDGEPEDRKFTIGYKHYKQNLCEVHVLRQSPLRKVIQNSKKFGQCTSILELKRQGIEMKDIANKNHYRQFYSGLSPDVEVKEFDAGETERAFFFIDPVGKIIQIIAYRNAHTENKKQKK